MTLYAGEVVRITNTATDFDGSLLDPTKVTNATVSVFDAAGAVVSPEVDMAWSVAALQWYWDWDTSGVAPGGYKAKVTVYTLNGGKSFEFKRIQLRTSPVPTSADGLPS